MQQGWAAEVQSGRATKTQARHGHDPFARGSLCRARRVPLCVSAAVLGTALSLCAAAPVLASDDTLASATRATGSPASTSDLVQASYDVIIVPRPNGRAPRLLTDRGWRTLRPRVSGEVPPAGAAPYDRRGRFASRQTRWPSWWVPPQDRYGQDRLTAPWQVRPPVWSGGSYWPSERPRYGFARAY